MTQSGTTTVDFGAFPGASNTSVAITGQTNIYASSFVSCWIVPTATADHSADEHIVDAPRVTAGNISAGTGFTIYAVAPSGVPSGRANNNAPRAYGQWTVAWAWR